MRTSGYDVVSGATESGVPAGEGTRAGDGPPARAPAAWVVRAESTASGAAAVHSVVGCIGRLPLVGGLFGGLLAFLALLAGPGRRRRGRLEGLAHHRGGDGGGDPAAELLAHAGGRLDHDRHRHL